METNKNATIRSAWPKSEVLQKQAVMVDITCLPNRDTDELFIASEFVIALNHGGTVHNMYDMQPVRFNPHDISVMLPNHVITNGGSTADYRATLIVTSKPFYEQLIRRDSFRHYLRYKNSPCYHLTDSQYGKVCDILRTLRLVVECEHPQRLTMIGNLLDILFYALTRYRGEEGYDRKNNQTLFDRFYDLLLDNFTLHHEVKWYANELCLTPKYFSSLIYKSSGKTAAGWIDHILTLEAKQLLKYTTDTSVKEIAAQLGFAETSSFCRFFKAQTGCPPSDYREDKQTD